MRVKTKVIRTFFFISIILLAFFGCGKKEGPREYLIGKDERFPRLNLMGKERSMSAFISELFKIVSRKQNLALDFQVTASNNLFPALDAGRIDAALITEKDSPTLLRDYLLSDPIYSVGPVVVIRKTDDLKELGFLRHKAIGIVRGESIGFIATTYPDAILRPYDTPIAALDDLTLNRIDAVVMDVLSGYLFTQGFYAGTLKIATKPLNREGLRLITKKTPKGHLLIDSFNQTLSILVEDGRYDDLLRKWGLINTRALKQ